MAEGLGVTRTIREWDGVRWVYLEPPPFVRRLYVHGDYCECAFCPFEIRLDRNTLLGGVRVLNMAYHPLPDLTLNAFNAILGPR
jgi:hypothetical protein